MPRTTQKSTRRTSAAPKKSPNRTPSTDAPRQRHELIGLVLIGVGVLLAAQIYFGFSVGPVGGWVEHIARLIVGRFVWLLPPMIIGLGGLLIFGEGVRHLATLRIGFLVTSLSLCLLLAASLFGISATPHTAWFRPHIMQMRGGVVGETLWYATQHTVGTLGTGLIGVLGVIAGIVLMTGASLGQALRRSGSGAATASRQVGRGMASATAQAVRSGRQFSTQVWTPVEERALDPGPSFSRHIDVVAPELRPIDGADYFPDVFDHPSDLPPSPALVGADMIEHDAPAPPPRRTVPVHSSRLDNDHFDDDEDIPTAQRVTPEPPHAAVREARIAHAERNGGRPSYRVPSRRLLKRTGGPGKVPQSLIQDTSRKLEEALSHFGITATVSAAVSGPRVTRYELQLAPGTKVGRITSLRDDLAYALAAREELRILAPIPGKQAVGVEVPNPEASLITLGDIFRDFPEDAGPLMVWLGLDISGKSVYVDLAKMPHLLIAGSTGTGKSVCLNVILASLLLRSSPNDVRMILIDPKKVELNHYESIPQLLTPVVTNMRDASAVLSNVVREMENRYELMGLARARNLKDWNAIRVEAGEETIPYMLVVIDELADLMMVAPAEVEDAIIRLAQKSRAVGIHLLLATQRPSADVITGMIKANVPSRIAFAVSSQVDSRVILDAGGAESLLGSGDMLYRPVGTSRLQRVQGAYVSEEEILAITNHWRGQGRPQLRTELMERPPEVARDEPDPEGDEMLARAIEMVVQQGTASVSLLQRRLGVGYARAGRLVDQMERLGVVSGHEGSKPRSVLIGEADLGRLFHRTDTPDDVEIDELDAELVIEH